MDISAMLAAGVPIERHVFSDGYDTDIDYIVDGVEYFDWDDPEERPMIEAIYDFVEGGHGAWEMVRATGTGGDERLVRAGG